MIAPAVREFLSGRHAVFTETWHPRVATALAEAHEDHTPPSKLVKTVLIRTRDGFLLAAIPANCKIDWSALARVTGAVEPRLATEEEVDRLFPSLELGAIPPLGPLFELPVFMDLRLARQDPVSFNAGSHTNTIHMTNAQFRELVHPVMGDIAVEA